MTATLGMAVAQSSAPSTASANLVSIRVKVENEHDDPKDSTTEVVVKKLNIELSAANSVTGSVQVNSTFYSRDLGSNTTVVEKKLESSANLDSSHSAVVTTAPVQFTYTPAFSKKVGNGRRAKFTKVEATGRKFYGWSVQIVQDGRLLGQASSASFLGENSKRSD